MSWWKILIGEQDTAAEKRRETRRKAKLKANKRKKPRSKHRKPGPAKRPWWA